MNRKGYGSETAKLRFLHLTILALDMPVGSASSCYLRSTAKGQSAVVKPQLVFREWVVGLGPELSSSCPFHHFYSSLLCRARFVTCLLVQHLPSNPVWQHHAVGDPLLVPLLSVGSACGISTAYKGGVWCTLSHGQVVPGRHLLFSQQLGKDC